MIGISSIFLHVLNILYLFISDASSDNNSSDDNDEFFNNWNPMVTDFLSQRNVLDIDDEDVGSALLGYSKANINVGPTVI